MASRGPDELGPEATAEMMSGSANGQRDVQRHALVALMQLAPGIPTRGVVARWACSLNLYFAPFQ